MAQKHSTNNSKEMSNFRWILGWLLLVFILSVNAYVGSCGSSGSYVDPLIRQKLARVDPLPGQNFDVDFAHYSGYISVNEEFGRAFFYWFVEADEDPSSKPLLLWLNGGPGCSSIAYGMAEEIGPFHIHKDGKSVYLNPHSWNKVSNVLFLDTPVGVGFSYSNTSSDLHTNGDKRTAQDNLEFLLGWFEQFPQYKGRDFFIAGESYGGHYVPQLSQAIVRYNSATSKKTINLKGYMVGNAVTDDNLDRLGTFQFMWSAGLISDETFKLLNTFCGSESFVHVSEACDNILDIADKELGDIDPYSIYTPACTVKSSVSNKLLRRMVIGHANEPYDPCTEKHSVAYFNLPEVQKALHVDPQFAPATWDTCSKVVSRYWTDSAKSVLDVCQELVNAGLRIWMFSGDTDAVIPVTSTRYSIDALKLPTKKPWHAWHGDDGQVAGWTQEYQGLTFVAVRGAGHEVPLHQPKAAFTLLKSFLAGESMPTIRQVSDI